jgi:hypothetical protein
MRWVKGDCTPPMRSQREILGVRVPRGYHGGSGVGQRFAESIFVLKFAYFEDFTAVQALYILCIVILGDELSSPVLAGRIGC